MKLAFDDIRLEEYSEAVEARRLGELLISEIPDHEHLQGATVGYVFRDDELRRHGKVTAAEAILVERILQSDKRWGRLVKWTLVHHILHLDAPPDFLVLIDRNIWEGMDADERLALVDHELSHAVQATEEDGETPKFTKDGNPVWAIKGHDVEEFVSVVERNGLWTEELREMARTIVNHLSNEAGHGAEVRKLA